MSAAQAAGARDVEIVAADPLGEDALTLLAEAVAEARRRYPEQFDPEAPAPTNAPVPSRGVFLLVRDGGAAVACGALRPLDAHCAEVRRMFVTARARRIGVARRLLTELESQGRRLGFARCVSKPAFASPRRSRCTRPRASGAFRRTASTSAIPTASAS